MDEETNSRLTCMMRKLLDDQLQRIAANSRHPARLHAIEEIQFRKQCRSDSRGGRKDCKIRPDKPPDWLLVF